MSKFLQDISIGENLRRLRHKRGLTQIDVCAKMTALGRPMIQSTYAQIETGTRNIFVSDLIALKQVLNAEYNEFFMDLVPVNKYEADDSPS